MLGAEGDAHGIVQGPGITSVSASASTTEKYVSMSLWLEGAIPMSCCRLKRFQRTYSRDAKPWFPAAASAAPQAKNALNRKDVVTRSVGSKERRPKVACRLLGLLPAEQRCGCWVAQVDLRTGVLLEDREAIRLPTPHDPEF